MEKLLTEHAESCSQLMMLDFRKYGRGDYSDFEWTVRAHIIRDIHLARNQIKAGQNA